WYRRRGHVADASYSGCHARGAEAAGDRAGPRGCPGRPPGPAAHVGRYRPLRRERLALIQHPRRLEAIPDRPCAGVDETFNVRRDLIDRFRAASTGGPEWDSVRVGAIPLDLH